MESVQLANGIGELNWVIVFWGRVLLRVDGHPVRGPLDVNRWRVRCRGKGCHPDPMSDAPAISDTPSHTGRSRRMFCPAPVGPSQRASRYEAHVLTDVITQQNPTSKIPIQYQSNMFSTFPLFPRHRKMPPLPDGRQFTAKIIGV